MYCGKLFTRGWKWVAKARTCKGATVVGNSNAYL